MNCPRCGHPVGDNANFCGGCGLPKADIIKYLQRQEEALNATQTTPVYYSDIHSNLNEFQSQLSDDIDNTSEFDYTTQPVDKSTISPEPEFVAQPEPEMPEYKYTPVADNFSATMGSEYVEEKDDEPLTTADFLWMLILSGIPIFGLFYLIYTAIQGKNQNKRSFARATLIFGIYAIVLAIVFVLGAMVAFM